MNAIPEIAPHNPIGTDGFEFVEFTAPNAAGIAQLRGLFTAMGFTETARHRSKEVFLFQQNGINFVLNGSPGGPVHAFAERHGPSACAMAFRVKNAAQAAAYVQAQGAKLLGSHANFGELNIPCVEGIGGSLLYLVDRYGERSIYDVDFDFIEGRSAQDNAVGLTAIDHLTHNVERGRMDFWAGFYARIAGFREIRYFDIEGRHTGLLSRAMTAPCGKIRIPINESADDRSQIAEFIRDYRGEGIQHIALTTDDIYATVRALRANGVEFMHTPDTYYEKVDARVPGHGEPLEALRELNILIDGAAGAEGILLQIFTHTLIGPIFFEIIQRKGNQGFGEGNFRALFESIEEDQIRRGVLKG
ncbi:4-hydroxyphenylpyruvate dioxygenase [Azotobacter beijerinckii]|uniref:4-hydroxyphenylpyruvate dioxygenase n=1 Tax=Azotobacter beijerinckii TaxID=170623 RepID=A0A1H6UJ64_9GAMM|nr:4-hydroxyphenylpyruvate dioxygenase [Azotobacter beijerinckii]SEI55442.1 4-hydroxyphenylpyruvate dioxygenase [Azotobacter beijerinckii]SEI92361.1 4-hydroxyphenylpyruvate dioxygenase [Azotobacter beijerinckii]